MLLRSNTIVALLLAVSAAAPGAMTTTTPSAMPRTLWNASGVVAPYNYVDAGLGLPWMFMPSIFRVVAIDKATGQRAPIVPLHSTSLPPLYDDSMVLAAYNDYLFVSATDAVALNASTLAPLWHTKYGWSTSAETNATRVYVSSTPLVVPQCSVVAFQGSNHMDLLSMADGSVRLRRLFGSSSVTDVAELIAVAGPTLLPNGRDVVVAEYTGNLTRLDACTGATIWSSTIGTTNPSNVVYDPASDLIITSTNRLFGGYLLAVHASNGTVAWIKYKRVVGELRLRDGIVYGLGFERVFAVYAVNGSQSWKNKTIRFSVGFIRVTAAFVLVPLNGVHMLDRWTGKTVHVWQPPELVSTGSSSIFESVSTFGISNDEQVAYVGFPNVMTFAVAIPPFPLANASSSQSL